MKAYKVLKGVIKLQTNLNIRYNQNREYHKLYEGDIFIIRKKEIKIKEYDYNFGYVKYSNLEFDFLCKIDKSGITTEHDIISPIILAKVTGYNYNYSDLRVMKIEELLNSNYIKEEIYYSRDEKIKEIFNKKETETKIINLI